MSKQNTPTPYIFKGISENGKNHFNIISSKLGGKYRICQVPFVYEDFDKEEAEQTARFIVKACNNHERLVEALEWAIERIRLPYKLNHLAPHNDEKYLEYKQLLTELKSQR